VLAGGDLVVGDLDVDADLLERQIVSRLKDVAASSVVRSK
jgi:hypothetical protein